VLWAACPIAAARSRDDVQRGEAAPGAAYQYLGDHWRQAGVTQAFWCAWAASFDRTDPQSGASFEFTGLNRFANGAFFDQPALSTYARVAAHFEGCHKASSGNCR
jgi:hypothetical protein